MAIKYALLTSVDLIVDLTCTHVTLHFEYENDIAQQAGPSESPTSC